MTAFIAKKNRGKYKGEDLYPHLHADGFYVATTSKFKADYIKVESIDELTVLVRAGYGARMSSPTNPQAPSYISHNSIIFPAREKPEPSLEKLLASFAEDDALDRQTVANRRKEQAFLRAYLLKGRQHAQCALCGLAFPAELLIAAHIKPRSICSQAEKLDFDNIATLMCALGCDSLFEKGFVFVSDGTINQNPKRRGTSALDTAINQITGRKVLNWPASSIYYDAHAKEYGVQSAQ